MKTFVVSHSKNTKKKIVEKFKSFVTPEGYEYIYWVFLLFTVEHHKKFS